MGLLLWDSLCVPMLRFSLLRGIVVAVATLLLCVPDSWAQNAVCSNALDAAEDQYVNAEYEEARRLVAACLNQPDIPGEQVVSAYRLLALIYLKQDQLEQARSAIVNLLGIDPEYTADPVNNPPSYVSLVAIVRRDVSREPEIAAATDSEKDDSGRRPFFRRSSTWITIGGIVVGSGVATVLALDSGSGGSGGGDPISPTALPLPPGTP